MAHDKYSEMKRRNYRDKQSEGRRHEVEGTIKCTLPYSDNAENILWHICSRQELWSLQRQPFLGNG
jgi:hypothetical protein